MRTIAETAGARLRIRSFGLLWAHIYREGEWIPEHKDNSGTCQLVISIRNNCAAGGGLFNVVVNGERQTFKLNDGDAILFDATRHSHWSTPIYPNEAGEAAERITFVARYFF